jgi:hypothetical protein
MPSTMRFPDVPPQVDPRKDIYKPLPATAHVVDWKGVDATIISTQMLHDLSKVVGRNKSDVAALEDLFRKENAFWRDTLSLTAHIRTLSGSSIIAKMLQQLGDARGVTGFTLTRKTSLVVAASPETVSVPLRLTRACTPANKPELGRLQLHFSDYGATGKMPR